MPTVPCPFPNGYYESREAFNQRALAEGVPVFWFKDEGLHGSAQVPDVAPLLFVGERTPTTPAEIGAAIASITDANRPVCQRPAPEPARDPILAAELAQLRPILVSTDFRDLSSAEKTMVAHVLDATRAVDRLHARQKGLLAVLPEVAKVDAVRRAMFARNWGPRCAAPLTENDPKCTALPTVREVPVDLYPAAMQSDPKFCAALEKHPDAKRLLDPFTVVREKGGKLVAVPYSDATTDLAGGKTSRWADDAGAAATSLDLAAKALEGTKETALAAYLKAAAKAFRDNSWFDADEAWSKMSAKNSRFYLRIAPDETYWEPCARKAGFHVSFARVSEASLAWQARLEPVKQSLEQSVATAIGAPYVARKVTFHLPEFIEVAWNGGDSRDAIGATIGQSLPNWGPVASKGRGRTVAMANLYTDPDSLASRERSARSLLCEDVMPHYPQGREPGLVATILHEATHNLGPSQEYRVGGKTDAQALGGSLASTMEELKAQTGALHLLELLREKKVIDETLYRQSVVDSVVWIFGQVSRGMTSPSGDRKPYGQLAAIQLGTLEEDGVLVYRDTKASNGRDAGCFSIEWSKFPQSAARMMSAVGKVKATGDKKAGEALTAKYVEPAKHHATIRERMLREPRPSFVYSVDLREAEKPR